MLSNFRAHQYSPLDSGSDVESSTEKQPSQKNWASILTYWREFVIICLCIVCAFLTFEAVYTRERPRAAVQEYQITSGETRWKQFHWNTQTYSSKHHEDDTAVDAEWEKIVPAFGFVAVEHEWAAEHNLPASMNLPSNHSKGVYIIDAYHQLHCLTIIRKTMMELSTGQPLSKPMAHSKHCFDSLLQYVMCGNSGDTLLYTWGRNETGDGQLRNCIDWDSRKKWAKENSACYMDGDHPIPLYDHFNHCEVDDDGLDGRWG